MRSEAAMAELGSARSEDRPPLAQWAWVLERRWTLAVGFAATIWAGAVLGVAQSLYASFHMQRYDLGNMVQAVWSTSQGRFLETTLGSGEQASRLASHVDPLLAALVPFWVAFPTPMSLVAAQVVACAFSAMPLFWIARRHLDEHVAAVLALAYLIYPWLGWIALDAIHPATLAIPLLLLAVLFLDADRLLPFALVAAPTALAGELVALAIAGLGLWYWLSRGHRIAGLTIAASGVAWTATCLTVIIPHYSGAESQYYGLYTAVGGSPQGLVRTTFTDPTAVLGELTTLRDLAYVLALGAPLAGAFFLAPLLLLPALPQLAASMLSSVGGHIDPRFHNGSVIIPFLWAATVFGLARLSPRRSTVVAALVLALSVGSQVALGPRTGPRGHAPGIWYYGLPPASHIDAVRTAVSLVPSDVPVAATTKAGSHLSAREHFFSVPVTDRATWVLVDTWDPWVPVRPRSSTPSMIGQFSPAIVQATVKRLRASPEWKTVYERSGVFVFRRSRPPPPPH